MLVEEAVLEYHAQLAAKRARDEQAWAEAHRLTAELQAAAGV